MRAALRARRDCTFSESTSVCPRYYAVELCCYDLVINSYIIKFLFEDPITSTCHSNHIQCSHHSVVMDILDHI